MTVDAHHHLWDVRRHHYPYLDAPWAEPLRRVFGPADLTAVTAPHQIEAMVLVQALSCEEETRELLANADATPLIAGVVGWVDLTAPDVAGRLAGLDHTALKGIRHPVNGESDPRWLLRDDVLRGLRAAGEAGLAYDLLITEREMPAAIEAATRLPQVRFVVDHLGIPQIADGASEPWATHLGALAALPNVTAKLSGVAEWTSRKTAVIPYAQHALEVFGPHRLMFGSDWPVCTLAASYEQVLETTETLLSGLDLAERTAVLDTTARRTYRLPARQAERADRRL